MTAVALFPSLRGPAFINPFEDECCVIIALPTM